jgi:hypothetical protein
MYTWCMKNKRKTNKLLLRECVKIRGLARIALEADCSPSLIQKLCSDSYIKVPGIDIIDGLCKATGHSLDELFPVFEAKKESA